MEIYITIEREDLGGDVFLEYFEDIDSARKHYYSRVQDEFYADTMVGIERYDTKKKKSKVCSIVSGHELSRQTMEWTRIKAKDGMKAYKKDGIKQKLPLVFGLEKEYILSLKLEEEE